VRRIAKWLPVVVLATLVAQAPVGADDDTLPPTRGSANLQLVAHLPAAGGTDLEFFTRELRTYRLADGTEITIPDEEPPVTRHFAMVGNQSAGPRIIDITNPEEPFVAASMPTCRPSQGDVQIRADGMIATLAKQGGSCTLANGSSAPHGSIIVDLANVYAPSAIAVAAAPRGAHNNTIHPSGNYVYISESGDSPGQVPIWDISNPAQPRKVKDWQTGGLAPSGTVAGDSPHDIRFSADGTRAYMAGIDQFRIVDTTNPENPQLISTFAVPGSTIGHDALVTPDKAFLFAGDELQGGGTAPCPGGAVYIYDIRGASEQNPILLGAVEAGSGPVTGRNNDEAPPYEGDIGGCTSHVMDMNPGNRSFTIGWYVSGLRTFDFSGLYNGNTPNPLPSAAWGAYGAGPVKESGWIVPEGANTWAAKQYQGVPGYIFADDLNLGFYVVKIKP
jgi:hypothetical protein